MKSLLENQDFFPALSSANIKSNVISNHRGATGDRERHDLHNLCVSQNAFTPKTG